MMALPEGEKKEKGSKRSRKLLQNLYELFKAVITKFRHVLVQ